MKFLIVQPAFIGDAILATPLIENLKIKYPDSTIDFLIRKGNEGLFHDHPHIRNVVLHDKKKGKYKSLFFLLKQIRAEKYDYVININRYFTSGILTAFSKAKNKVGFNKNPLSFLFSKKIKHQQTMLHEVDRNLLLLKDICDVNVRKPKLYPNQLNFNVVKKEKEYICIAPSTLWPTKKYPNERWIELINKLPNKYKICLIAGNSDYEECEDIKLKVKDKDIENLAGKYNLIESAALIKNAKIIFANDSAPVHIASAMNSPTVAIFCSTIPEFGFGPLADISIIIQNPEKLACRPCGLHGMKICKEGHFLCSKILSDFILKQVSDKIEL